MILDYCGGKFSCTRM